ncbi:hypothetical protein FG386_002700 [Cryptosporidium ryanae]|uniref:uncharacterized protein n=1 Tax=Cryptosporidium ryanae TaxID=515981 RepID=UPI00351A4917|nr:hypothetical protein FG386_002700 [Cryptosporidium ryanae]
MDKSQDIRVLQVKRVLDRSEGMDVIGLLRSEIEGKYLRKGDLYGFSVVGTDLSGSGDPACGVRGNEAKTADGLPDVDKEVVIGRLQERCNMLRRGRRDRGGVEEQRERRTPGSFEAGNWLLSSLERLNLELTPENEVRIGESRPAGRDDAKYKSDLRRDVKEELRRYESGFELAHNFPPSKTDKEPLRPLYSFYKKLCGERAGPPGARIEELRRRRMVLREKLERYQQTFEKENNRKILYHKDLLPVESEYNEYKSIRAEIKRLETEENG